MLKLPRKICFKIEENSLETIEENTFFDISFLDYKPNLKQFMEFERSENNLSNLKLNVLADKMFESFVLQTTSNIKKK